MSINSVYLGLYAVNLTGNDCKSALKWCPIWAKLWSPNHLFFTKMDQNCKLHKFVKSVWKVKTWKWMLLIKSAIIPPMKIITGKPQESTILHPTGQCTHLNWTWILRILPPWNWTTAYKIGIYNLSTKT